MTLEEQTRALLAESLAGLAEAPPELDPDEAEFPEIEVDDPLPEARPARPAPARSPAARLPAARARAAGPPPPPAPVPPVAPSTPPRLFTPEMMEELEVSLRSAQRGLARVQEALAVMRQATGWPGSYQAPVLRRSPAASPRSALSAPDPNDRRPPALPAAQIFGPPGSRWSPGQSVLPTDLITEEEPPPYQGEE